MKWHVVPERRFELADERKRLPGKSRAGLIVGESADHSCWWIVFDGTRTRVCYHKSFIKDMEPTETK